MLCFAWAFTIKVRFALFVHVKEKFDFLKLAAWSSAMKHTVEGMVATIQRGHEIRLFTKVLCRDHCEAAKGKKPWVSFAAHQISRN